MDHLTFLNERREGLIDFLTRLVAAPSPNPPGDEARIAAVVRDELERLGVDATVLRTPAGRANVVARVEGGVGPTVLLNGHLDTKPPGVLEQWEADPYQATERDGRLYGLGTADMKAGVAALVYATVAAARARLHGTILLALTADEEAGSLEGARFLLDEVGLRADVGLVAEPCGLTRDWERICLASRGSILFRLRVKGTQTHSSIADIMGARSATLDLAFVLRRLHEELAIPHRPHPYYPQGITKNIGAVVQGGVFYGVRPGAAEALSDIRLVPGVKPAEAMEVVRAFVEELRLEEPGLRVEVMQELGDPRLNEIAQPEVDPRHPLVKALLDAAEAVLGRRPPVGGLEAVTDAVYWHNIGGIPTIPAFGPGTLTVCHSPNEYVAVDAVTQAAEIYTRALVGFLG